MTGKESPRPAIGIVNVRDLSRKTSKVVEEVEHGTSYVVVRRGIPVATVTPIDVEAFEDFVLANAPEFVASRRDADRDLTRGETVSLSEFLTGNHSPE